MILGDRFIKPGEVVVFPEEIVRRIEQSGGVFEVLDRMIKNPLKHLEQAAEPEPAPEVAVEAPKRRGRPPKNASKA